MIISLCPSPGGEGDHHPLHPQHPALPGGRPDPVPSVWAAGHARGSRSRQTWRSGLHHLVSTCACVLENTFSDLIVLSETFSFVFWRHDKTVDKMLEGSWVQFRIEADLQSWRGLPGWTHLNWVPETGSGKVKAAGVIMSTSPSECWLVYTHIGGDAIYPTPIQICVLTP